jgi:2-hydroxychromene-2-carboxylate isomerase
MSSPIDFWFSIGSTYTYLSVMRIEEIQRQSGVAFRWRPFDVRAIMIEMDNIPFSDKRAKARYMWRDIERRAKMHGVPWSAVPLYPIKHLAFANRIAVLGEREGWCGQYVKAAYRRWFLSGCDPSIEPDLSGALHDIGQDADAVLALAASDETKTALESQTDVARSLGIFGSPTFAIGDEIFWGDDRLEDAIQWHRQSNKRASPMS